MTVTALDIPYRKRRANNLHRSAVYHLARVLYVAEVHGWQSLSLAPSSTSCPQEQPRPSRSGFVRFACFMPIGEVIADVDVMLTSREYDAALQTLPPAQVSEVHSYYTRKPSKGDVCPALEDSHYRATYLAFAALLDTLIAQGLLKVKEKRG